MDVLLNPGNVTEVILGVPGPAGPSGSGVPIGGSAGAVLSKASATDNDVTWNSIGDGFQIAFNTLSLKSANTNNITISASGVDLTGNIATPGTSNKITYDQYGRVTSGTSETTLAGIGITDADTTVQIDAKLALKADLASPTFTGTVTVPTPLTADNSTKAASTAYVQAQGYLTITGKAADANLLDGQDSPFYLAWANFTGTPTTVGGYGITDAYTKAQVDAADALLIPLTQKAAINGVATLDGAGLIPTNQLPPLAISNTFPVASEAAMLALNAQTGDVAIRSDTNQSFILNGTASVLADWNELLSPADGVLSVTGGLGLLGGTITSTGTLDVDFAGSGVANTAARSDHGHAIADTTGLQTALDGKLAVGAKAADSDLLDGVDGAGYVNVAGAQTITGLKTFNYPSGIALTTASTNQGVFLNSTHTNAASRNWFITASNVSFGDFAIVQSNTKGGDPRSAGTARFYIDANGNVGIGTTTPSEKLDVVGTIKTDTGLTLGSNALAITQSGFSVSIPQLFVQGVAGIGVGPDGLNVVTMRSGSRVGISVDTDANNPTNNYVQITKWNGSYGDLFNIDPTGNVGINTITPTEKLHVAGNALAYNVVRWKTVMANYTAVAGDGIRVDTTAAPVVITLPAGVDGQVIEINDYAQNAHINYILVNGIYMNQKGDFARFVHDGTEWKVTE